MSYRIKNLMLMMGALLVGLILYVLFRPEIYITKFVTDIIFVEAINHRIDSLYGVICGCYLPDFLWGFSLSCGLCSLFPAKSRNITICCIVSFCYGLLWEITQFLSVVGGTADYLDVLAYFLAACTCLILNKKGIHYEEA